MKDREPCKVLLVEDNPGDADLAREKLSESPDHAFEVIHAPHLAAALSTLQAEKVDAIVLDLNLPDSSGLDTLRGIRKLDSQTPIVVLSGNSDDDLRRAALAEGAHDVFGKSESPARQFSRSIAYVIERWRVGRQNEQIRKIVTNTPDAVVVSDPEGVVKFVNDAALQLFAKHEKQLLGTPIGFPMADGMTTEIEISREGGTRVGEMRVAGIDWQNQPALLASIRDISEKKEMETEIQRVNKHLEEANRRLSEFASLVSHDLKSPMMTVLGYARLSLTEAGSNCSPKLLEFLQRILKSTERMERVIGEVRRLSEWGAGDVDIGTIDTAEIVQDMLADMRFALEKTGAQASAKGHLPKVQGNETLVRQVFQNLLENGIKFQRPHVPACVYISASVMNGWAEFQVIDNGIGIAKEAQSQIFQIFKRLHTPKEFEGSGIGLAVCEKIIHRFGGRIWVESEPGAGCRFCFTLRAAEK